MKTQKYEEIAMEIVQAFFPVSDGMQEAYMIQEIGKKIREYGNQQWEDSRDLAMRDAKSRLVAYSDFAKEAGAPDGVIQALVNAAATMNV